MRRTTITIPYSKTHLYLVDIRRSIALQRLATGAGVQGGDSHLTCCTNAACLYPMQSLSSDIIPEGFAPNPSVSGAAMALMGSSAFPSRAVCYRGNTTAMTTGLIIETERLGQMQVKISKVRRAQCRRCQRSKADHSPLSVRTR